MKSEKLKEIEVHIFTKAPSRKCDDIPDLILTLDATDRPFHNFWASKCGAPRSWATKLSRSADFEAIQLWKGRSG